MDNDIRDCLIAAVVGFSVIAYPIYWVSHLSVFTTISSHGPHGPPN